MAIQRILLPIGAVAAVALAAPTMAAKNLDADVVRIEDWNYQVLYDRGFSAAEFMDNDVVGRNGEEIGEVEDLVVNRDGRISHAIVETGGFLDIGDRHIMVPLDRASITGERDLMVDVKADRIDDYSLFGDDVDDEELPGRKWRVSELIGDYAYLKDRERFGYVDDVIVSSDGQIRAVVVDPDVTYGARGPYALPYYGYGYSYGFDPGREAYDSPYTARELENLDRFERERLSGEYAPVVIQ